MDQFVTPWWQDKTITMIEGFLLTLIGNAVGRKFGVELNTTEILSLLGTITAFILGHKWKTTVLTKAAIQQGAAVAANPLKSSAVTDR